jgi:hypothetical protein
VQQGGERGDVVALERVDVAGEQVAVFGVEGFGRGRRPDRRAGPLQGAVRRGDGGVEQLGDLGGGEGEHVAEDQHGPLPRRQLLQGGDEREPDRVALRGHLGGVAEQRVGQRLDPRARRQGLAEVGSRGGGRGEVHRAGAALGAAQHVEADVRGDRVEPGPHGCLRGVVLGPPRPDERLLHGVLGLGGGAQHPVAVPDELPAVGLERLDRRHDLTLASLRWTRQRRAPGSRPRG